MLNIGKLGADGAEYYLATVASGVLEYYTGRGEAPGRWIGRGADRLGLSGVAKPSDVRDVLAARHPSSGEDLLSNPRKVPGFDLTFRPPKSVSLLWALSDSETALEVRRAHDAAVAAAVDYLERNAAYTRRGRGGAERVAVDGFVAATFRHRTSRAQDPLLHTHVLVANLALTPDDQKWRTLDGRQLYLQAKTTGFLYQAQLRAEMTRRLGVEWGPVRNGYADVAGVPRDVIEAFSRRRADVLAAMGERGEDSARAAQVATLATRPAKKPTPGDIHHRWRERAAELGFDAGRIATLRGRAEPSRPTAEQITETRQRLLGPTGLTAKLSTFTRRDVAQAWCLELRGGADVTAVERLTDHVLDRSRGDVLALNGPGGEARRLRHGEVIRLADGRPVPAAPDEVRFTTPELLAVEKRLVDDAVSRRDDGAGMADAPLVDQALAKRPTLSQEQSSAVRRLTRSGAGVEVVVGKAGSGKTYMLAAANDAWRASGFDVVGAALAARAALELQEGSGIPSGTIDRLLIDLQQPGGALTDRSVVVVDEAAMAGTRTLARVLDAASDGGAKVVLVGDHHQLPEIHTGGAFAGLVNRLPAVELTDNRRQADGWERDALDELRDGDVVQAVAAYAGYDRIRTADTADAVREQLVGDWWHATAEHGAQAVMVAARLVDVDDLNARARERMNASGDLAGPELHVSGRTFRAGDRLLCLRNQRGLGVLNGMRGTVTSVDPNEGSLTFVPDGRDRAITLPPAYLASGHVDHGYALTAHKAQGMTCEETFVLATDAIYREWGYVALSRGRRANHLYLLEGTDPDPVDDPTHPEAHQPDDRDPATALTVRLRRSGAQALALDHLPDDRHIDNDPEPSGYLRALLGHRPEDLDSRLLWDRAATAVEAYRRERGITDPEAPLGAPPDDLPGRAAYREVTGAVVRARRQLRAATRPEREATRGLSRDIG